MIAAILCSATVSMLCLVGAIDQGWPDGSAYLLAFVAFAAVAIDLAIELCS